MIFRLITNLERKFRHLRLVTMDSRWWPFYLQRRFMGASSREKMARFIAGRRPKIAPQTALKEAEHTAAIEHSGITRLGQVLSAERASELYNYFRVLPVSDTYRPEFGSFLPESTDRNPVIHTAHHASRDIVLAPYLFALANDPAILRVASRFLGCRATLGYTSVWWSYNTPLGAQEAENFHRDVDDWKFLKLFVYLTDVTRENGPHVYVSHSVRSPKLRVIRRFEDQEVIDAFGSGNILELTAPAGAGFLENTFGVHKGTPVVRGRRLMFQAVYSLSALPYSPNKPVADFSELKDPALQGLSDWTNRLYINARDKHYEIELDANTSN
jgi:hypothetical protein